MIEQRLCKLDEIAAPKGSKGFSLSTENGVLEMFLVRDGDQVFGYRNSCPHTGATLQWMADKFLDLEESYIQCSIHGAIFNIDDGLCVGGPCGGQSLEKLDIAIRDEVVYLLR